MCLLILSVFVYFGFFVVFNLERGVFNRHKLWFSAKLCQLALFTSLLAA